MIPSVTKVLVGYCVLGMLRMKIVMLKSVSAKLYSAVSVVP